MQIDRERLARFFTELCETESPSRNEEQVSSYLQKQFKSLGADAIITDTSAAQTGSNTGNLVVRFQGSQECGAPLFFACHMDTVGPTDGVAVSRNGDIFTSTGDTILGADDKSGIAALLELMTLLKQNGTTHCPIELVFTTCEEIGLLGAKAFDPGLLGAAYGYALDSTKNDTIITGAPAANRLKITIRGKAAHSGSAPEDGVNALALAAEAITQIKLGRLDTISTANFGLIHGGTATNIIPDHVVLEGEVRSHSSALLAQYTDHISAVFKNITDGWPAVNNFSPSLTVEVYEDFPLMDLQEDEPVLQRVRHACEKINRPPVFDKAGGGSDANIFCGLGLKTAILPTGMDKVHTTEEQVDLNDMVKLTELLLAMVSQPSQNE